jgi:hypothetical protein
LETTPSSRSKDFSEFGEFENERALDFNRQQNPICVRP